jgi:phenylalanyl-tRNA synthetase alpha chain
MATSYTETIEKVKLSLIEDISHSATVGELKLLEVKYLGRQGEVNKLFKSFPIKDNPLIGKEINELKNLCAKLLAETVNYLLSQSPKDAFDVTVPGIQPPKGSLHLITQAITEIEDIFSQLGFVRRRYPEVETDWYYAEGLNIPKEHPARDDQETFYVAEDVVLTAHTSNGQLREMEKVKTPPIKMINIGKTYRRQADTTHSPMFHQFEGLVVDKNINITHLIGVTDYFAKSYFGNDRSIRLRPHHFQFTEPSFEIDISCGLCHGKGEINGTPCKICKSGWLELGGAGMVHPNVLKNGGIDPNIYSGFAFGWGVERVLMMKSGLNLPDLRLLYTDDLRFLKQF